MRWVAATGQFYYLANGDPERMLGMAVDITERRRSEEALRLFRKLIDETTDAIEVVDPTTLRFLDVNDKSCRDLGYTREELLSLNVSDIDPGVNESRLVRIAKELEQSGFVTFESLTGEKTARLIRWKLISSVSIWTAPTSSTWFAILLNVSRSRRRCVKKARNLRKLSVWPD